jgi:mRNA interferase RelE/StbE
VPEYSITFARSARKEVEALDPAVARRILKKIEALGDDPRPHGVRKLEGAENLCRMRVGDWRVIYHVVARERIVDVVAVRHRSDAYR